MDNAPARLSGYRAGVLAPTVGRSVQPGEQGATMDELPADHPAAELAPAEGDCPSHIPAEVKEQAAAAHGNREPSDSPVRAGELV
jgi:hypothetical protein